MGYLTSKDYKKIKEMIEVFLSNPTSIDKLYNAIYEFLESKNTIKEPKIVETPYKYGTHFNIVNSKDYYEGAKTAMSKYNKKLREEGVKYKKMNCKTDS